MAYCSGRTGGTGFYKLYEPSRGQRNPQALGFLEAGDFPRLMPAQAACGKSTLPDLRQAQHRFAIPISPAQKAFPGSSHNPWEFGGKALKFCEKEGICSPAQTLHPAFSDRQANARSLAARPLSPGCADPSARRGRRVPEKRAALRRFKRPEGGMAFRWRSLRVEVVRGSISGIARVKGRHVTKLARPSEGQPRACPVAE